MLPSCPSTGSPAGNLCSGPAGSPPPFIRLKTDEAEIASFYSGNIFFAENIFFTENQIIQTDVENFGKYDQFVKGETPLAPLHIAIVIGGDPEKRSYCLLGQSFSFPEFP